jgi:hypothetical protein
LEHDVNTYGYLYGGDELFSVDTAQHHWEEPYPVVDGHLGLTWDPGDSGRKPNIFMHNLLRDFFCDRRAYQLLVDLVGDDLRVIAHGDLDGAELTVVQATTVLAVVDEERSIPSEYSWARFSFPHIREEAGALTENRIFRVPYPELSLLVLAGDSVRTALESAGISGLRYEPAQVEQ